MNIVVLYGTDRMRNPHHGHHYHKPQKPHGVGSNEILAPIIRIHCKANPDYFLTARDGFAVLAVNNPDDLHQQWIKDDSWGIAVRDASGFPAFALVNRGTGTALTHGDNSLDRVELKEYDRHTVVHSNLWTVYGDIGGGYDCLRHAKNITLNMDARGGGNHGEGIHDGTDVILYQWTKTNNQYWKLNLIEPIQAI